MVSIRGGRCLEVARLVLREEGEGEAGARLEPLLRQDTFSTLRSICKIRPVGASKALIVLCWNPSLTSLTAIRVV